MNKENNIDVKKGLSAGIFTILRGKVSNFNQCLIIGLATLLILAGICIANFSSHPKIFIPLFILSAIGIFALIIIGIIRNCSVKSKDEIYPFSAKFVGLNKVVEMKNVPKSMLTKELFMTVASLVFPENEPPVGLIEGDVTDKKSIRMLEEEERKQFKKKEEKKILEHQHKIAQELRQVKQALPVKETPKTDKT